MKYLCLLLLVACSTEPEEPEVVSEHVRLYVDVESFQQSARWDEIRAAADFTVAFYQERGFTIERVMTREEANTDLFFGPLEGWLGYAQWWPGYAEIEIKLPLENGLEWWWESDGVEACQPGMPDAVGIILHEVGHVLGLHHVDDPTDLMNPAQQDSCVAVRKLSQRRK